jgi:hypothetical protein
MRRELARSWSWLKFPLQKGATWGGELSSRDTERKAVLEFTAEDEEEVVVPAGTYKARRVRMIGREDGKDEKGIELTMWLAPDVGEVKRTVKLFRGADVKEEATLSLLRFDQGK